MHRLSQLKPIIYTAVITYLVCFLLANFVVMLYAVSGTSMEPNFHNGEFGVGNRLYASIHRFDVCLTKRPDNTIIIKRVIGLPGEKIEFKNNELYIGGIKTDQPFMTNGITEDFSITLKEDEYFLMGDNRNHSSDSRVIGPVHKSEINAVLF